MDFPSPSTRAAMISADYISTCNDGVVAPTSAMSKALMNPLILDIIFQPLSISDLKSCRLVCHAWSDHSVNLLGKRAYLNLNWIFDYDQGSKLSLATVVNDKLFRRVKIYDDFDLSAQRYKAIDVITKGLDILKSKDIRHVALFMGYHDRCEDVWIPQPLATHPNLTTIEYRPYGSTHSYVLHPVLQGLIESAPNLTLLDVKGSSFPDLKGCRNLESLKFEFIEYTSTAANMTVMLGQVKDSLTRLEFRCKNCFGIRLQSQNTDLPVMSKLTSLTIHRFDLIPGFLNEKHFPALKKLSLENVTSPTRILPYLNLLGRHCGVQSLELADSNVLCKGEFSEKIVQLFPSVKNLELKVFFVDERSIHEVNLMMQPVQLWDLDQATVYVEWVGESGSIVVFLKNMSVWKGIKRVHFKRTSLTQNDLASHVQDIILYSAGFESLKFSGHDYVPDIVELKPSVSQENGLPIQFTGPEIMKKMQPFILN